MAPPIPTTQTHEAAPGVSQPDTVLAEALNRLLAPLARLCLANGATFAAVEDSLKRAFIQEADKLQPDAPRHGMVSRISTATGISRREVTRLTAAGAPARTTKPPLATEVFARWTTDPALRDQNGAPSPLKRQGPAPSFEALAHSITRDIHPRSMLDELIRLGIVRHDTDADRVVLVRSDFVPAGDVRQQLGFLGDNVGDHLEAAVDNVVHDGSRHHEQAVFADELSAESVEALRPLIAAQWQTLRDALVPVITEFIEADRIAGRIQDRRVRIGMYTFNETTPDNGTPADKTPINHKETNEVHK
jgi:hypothetical protein